MTTRPHAPDWTEYCRSYWATSDLLADTDRTQAAEYGSLAGSAVLNLFDSLALFSSPGTAAAIANEVDANVQAMILDTVHRARQDAVIEAGFESSRRQARLVAALVTSDPSDTEGAVRVLAAAQEP